MLDSDLAALYETETKALNQAVKRNIKRFPKDFMFQLSKKEFEDLRLQIETSKKNTEGLRSQIVTSGWGGYEQSANSTLSGYRSKSCSDPLYN